MVGQDWPRHCSLQGGTPLQLLLTHLDMSFLPSYFRKWNKNGLGVGPECRILIHNAVLSWSVLEAQGARDPRVLQLIAFVL